MSGAGFGAVLLVAAPILILFLVLPRWALGRKRKIERSIGGALSRNQLDVLPDILERERLFRMFASPAHVNTIRGNIAAAQSKHSVAKAAFEAAQESYRGEAPPELSLGLAEAAFRTGDLAGCIAPYRRALEWDPTLSRANRSLASALLQLGEGETDEAHTLLQRTSSPASEKEARTYRFTRWAAAARAGESVQPWKSDAGTPETDEEKALHEVAKKYAPPSPSKKKKRNQKKKPDGAAKDKEAPAPKSGSQKGKGKKKTGRKKRSKKR